MSLKDLCEQTTSQCRVSLVHRRSLTVSLGSDKSSEELLGLVWKAEISLSALIDRTSHSALAARLLCTHELVVRGRAVLSDVLLVSAGSLRECEGSARPRRE